MIYIEANLANVPMFSSLFFAHCIALNLSL